MTVVYELFICCQQRYYSIKAAVIQNTTLCGGMCVAKPIIITAHPHSLLHTGDIRKTPELWSTRKTAIWLDWSSMVMVQYSAQLGLP